MANWSDLNAFVRWSSHLPVRGPALAPPAASASFRTLYRDTGCNYPPLGAIASAGAMAFIGELQSGTGWRAVDPRQVFRWYLAAFEGIALLLMRAILTSFQTPRATALAAGFYLLPSSWAGGAIWGQIDVIATVLALLAAWCFLRVALADASVPGRDLSGLALGALALSGMCSMKQTAVFSLPGILLLAGTAVAAVGYRHGVRYGLRGAALALLIASVSYVALDRLVFAPPVGHNGVTSHVWTAGAWHTRKLSGNGPNVWTFLGRPNASSSDVPFLGALTPRQAGYAAFVGSFVLLAWLQIAAFRIATTDRLRFVAARRPLCATLLVLTGLTHLAMGIFVAGTHERHMVQAFPFLLAGAVALLGCQPSARLPRLLLAVGVAAASVYGAFVYEILRGGAWLGQTRAAAALLVAFFVLAGGYIGVLLAYEAHGSEPAAN